MNKPRFACFSFTVFWLASVVSGVSGCDASHSDDSSDDVGSVMLALTTVPMDVSCIEVNVTAATRAVTKRVDVTAGQSAALSVTGLPVGAVTIDERTFSMACTAVQATTSPTWISEAPASVNLLPGAAATGVNIVLRRPGQVQITNDFQNGPPTGSGLTTLAGNQGPVYGLAVDASSLYWTTLMNGTVNKLSLNGGLQTTIAVGQAQPADLVVSGGEIIWMNEGSGTIVKAPLAGGALTQLAAGQSPTGLTADATNVYWTNSNGTVMKLPRAGGAQVALATVPGTPGDIAVHGATLYWTNLSTGVVSSVPVAGGAITTIAAGPSGADRISVDAAGIYWGNRDSGTVNRIDLTGGMVTTLVAGMGGVGDLTSDGANLYVAFSSAGRIVRIARTGGIMVNVASGMAMPTVMAVDNTSVYWANSGTGTIMKAAK